MSPDGEGGRLAEALGRVYVAGHTGLVGRTLVERLQREGCREVLTADHAVLDLTDQQGVRAFFRQAGPIDLVVVAAARVGGIHANATYPAEFIYQNLMIEANLIHEAHRAGVNRLLFFGSSCAYPRQAPQPMAEELLMSGPVEPTSEPYAVAKMAGITLCTSYNRQYGTRYRCVIPASLYGPGDNFHPQDSHVLPALLRRFHEAKENGRPEVVIWGSGRARREFLYVEDLVTAALMVATLSDERLSGVMAPVAHLNVGSGEDATIAEVAETVREVVGYGGRIVFDPSRPDGAPRKLLAVSRIRQLGWVPAVSLLDGLRRTYAWFLAERDRMGW